MPKTTAGRNGFLNTGRTAFTHVGALTALTPTEVSGGSYARQAYATSAAASGFAANTGTTTIPIPAGNTVIAIALYDALTSGNMMGYYPYGSTGNPALQGVASLESTTTETLRSNGHGLAADNRIFFSAINNEALPTGINATTLYFVRSSGLTSDTFTVSTTSGGAAVDMTTLGEVAWFKTAAETFTVDGNITIAAGALPLDARFI